MTGLVRSVLIVALSTENRIHLPLCSEGGSQQGTCTVKVGFRRAGCHLQLLTNLSEAQLMRVAQEDHQARPGG